MRRLTPHEWNRYFLPHHFQADPADFHDWLDERLHNLHERRGTRLGVIAPREGAKSTWFEAYALRAAVEGWESHIVYLSDSWEMAEQHLSMIRTELEENERLAAVYPEACGLNPDEWRTDRLRLRNSVLFKSLGRGSNIRGRKDRQNRPTLVIVDDCQGNKSIVSPTDREHTLNWMFQEVIPAGSDRTNFISIGSALHREALAVHVQSRAGWTGKTFRAVHEWPARMDLWEEWERLATNLADEERDKTAQAFLEKNRAEMIIGAVTFWPGYKPIEVLMKRRAEIGSRRFETEYQGVPGSPEGCEWPSELFDRTRFWFDDWPEPEETALKVQSLDPSKGTDSKSADYQAHVTCALHRDGTFYLDCELRKEPNWCARALDIAARFHPREIVAESNCTMGLMLPEMERLLRERPGTTYRPVVREENHSDNKLTRMRALTPYLQRGQIRVRNSTGGRMLVEQMRDVPHGSHDDGPDAAATAVLRIEEIYHGGR